MFEIMDLIKGLTLLSKTIFHMVLLYPRPKLDIIDDRKKAGSPDRDLINVNEPYELRNWADKFGVTHARLKAAVNVVGTSAKKVEAYLNKNK